jgi:alkylation response protein AidB-like acyl-CoA dehydrogenase
MSDWAARVAALKPTILAGREAMDAARRCPDEIAAAMADIGVFRLCVPKAYGGLEANPLAMFETLEALAEIDASPAWVAMIGATTGALAAYLEPEAARDIFGPADTIVTGVYAPSGRATQDEGGYRATGRWRWNSGGQNAHWLAGGCMILGDDGEPRRAASGAPDARMILVPRRDVSFVDTWHTAGLKGTGSGDMVFEGLRAPSAHSVSLVDDAPRVAAPLYAFPVFGLLAMGIASVACGNAKAALAAFAETARSKRAPNGKFLSERGAVQVVFAQATAEWRAARAMLVDEIGAAWRAAESGDPIPMAQRAGLRLAATHMTRTAAAVVRTLQDFAGGGSVFLDDPLQRRLADAQTMTAHIMIAPGTYELTGRVLLGGSVPTSEL